MHFKRGDPEGIWGGDAFAISEPRTTEMTEEMVRIDFRVPFCLSRV